MKKEWFTLNISTSIAGNGVGQYVETGEYEDSIQQDSHPKNIINDNHRKINEKLTA